jgi:drug/metabolite transporter superfamily protein YnfA
MTRPVLVAVGAVLVLFGGVFALQGVGVLGGSAMSGETLWAILGPIIAVVGLGVVVLALRRRT